MPQGDGQGPDTGGGSAGGSSSAGGTATPTVEELQAELSTERAKSASLSESVRGLTPFKGEAETLRARNAELEAGGTGGGGTDSGDDGVYVTRAQATEIGREQVTSGIKAYVEEQNRLSKEQAKQNLVFANDRQKWLRQAEKDFPDTLTKDSPLVKKSMEIFEDPNSGLSRREKDWLGNEVVVPSHASAEYDAVSRASKALESQGSAAKDASAGADFSGGGGPGGGGSASTTGELSDEEFLKLSPEEQAKYEQRRFAEKGAT